MRTCHLVHQPWHNITARPSDQQYYVLTSYCRLDQAVWPSRNRFTEIDTRDILIEVGGLLAQFVAGRDGDRSVSVDTQ